MLAPSRTRACGVSPDCCKRPEFIAFAKADPGRLNMGSGGVGSNQHVSGELFKMMTGVNIVHVREVR